MREKIIKSCIPYYSVAILWLLSSCFFPMYRWYHFLILIGFSFLVFFTLERAIPVKKIMVAEPYEPIKTGISDVDKVIEEGMAQLHDIQKMNAAIAPNHPEIAKKITLLQTLIQKILDYIGKNPQKVPRIRRFMSYYMPTLLKLLQTYSSMADQTIKGENITATMKKIEDITETLVSAFEKQLDYLYQDEALDISTDITVLEGLLAKEGFTGETIQNGGKKDE